MAFTSIFGIQSGFDSASLVQKLIALEARPMDLKLAQLQAKETELEAFQNLRTHLQTFQSVLTRMGSVDRFNETTSKFTVTAGTGNVLNVSASSSASIGSHDITVNVLAQETTLLSDTGYASVNDVVPSGAGGPGTTYHVEINVGGALTVVNLNPTDTVQDVVDAINASGADVTASAIDDGSAVNPIKIVIQGNQAGAANAVSAFTYRNPGGGGAQVTEVTFSATQAAQDASVTVDGITFARTSNTISDVIPGVTLNLESLGSGTLTISTDNTAIAGNVQDFVDAFNELVAFIDKQTTFNPETFETGVLFGNSSVQSLETSLRRIATGQVAGNGTFEFLSQVGITTQDDGQLFLDEVKLDEALTTDLNSVVSLFASNNGVIPQLDNQVSLLLDSSQKGPLTSELDSLTESIDDLNDTLLRMDDRLELFEKNIRQQFVNLEIILGKLDAQRTAFKQALQNLGTAFGE